MKPFIIQLTKPFYYEDAERKKVILEPGHVLWTQATDFTFEQIAELQTTGFHLQFGFGPASIKVPSTHLAVGKITYIKI